MQYSQVSNVPANRIRIPSFIFYPARAGTDKNGDGPVGAISENGLFQKVFSNPDIKNEKVETVMEPSYPLVEFNTPVEKLRTIINKENGAVLSKDEGGNFHIVTKYDVIQALGN
jgi:cystathionine beta-synthase